MQKFCGKCGSLLDGAIFCPKCGQPVGEHGRNTYSGDRGSVPVGHENRNSSMKRVSVLFPVMYLILLFCDWFKISLPILGEYKFTLYNVFKGISDLFECYPEFGGNDIEQFVRIYVYMLIIMAAVIILAGTAGIIMTALCKKPAKTWIIVSSAAAIVEAVLIIGMVTYAKAEMRSGGSEITDWLGTELSKTFSLEPPPVIMLIAGIVGIAVSCVLKEPVKAPHASSAGADAIWENPNNNAAYLGGQNDHALYDQEDDFMPVAYDNRVMRENGTGDCKGAPNPILKCVSGEFKGCEFPVLMNDRIVIGRDYSCNIKFDSYTPNISRRHCMIEYNGAFWITDLNSTMGTYLSNGVKLSPNIRTELKNGSGFYLGTRSVSFSVGQ